MNDTTRARRSLRTTVPVLCIALCAPASGGAPDMPVTTRVFVGECLVEVADDGPRTAGLAGAAVGTAIRGGLGRLGRALRTAGASRTRTAVARLNLQLEPGESPACVQLAHGAFAPCETTTEPWLPAVADATPRSALSAGVCLAGEPAVFVELALRRSADGRALALAPTLLHYARTLDGRSRARQRALAVQLAFHAPGDAPGDGDATGALVVFGDTPIGSSMRIEPQRPRLVRAHESGWFPTPFPPSSGELARPYDGDTTSGTPASVPSTLTATLVETRDERPFLLFLADMLDGTSEELRAGLETLVLRDRRREARIADARRRELALVELAEARTAAILAQREYCALPADDSEAASRARLVASTALLRAQVEANLAADAAGRPRPFVPPITPSPGPPRGC